MFGRPEPFDRTKLLLVDDAFTLLGSANWDPRSLRLNFELGVECYDTSLNATLTALVDEKVAGATRVTAGNLAALPRSVRLRNAIARLFSPYL